MRAIRLLLILIAALHVGGAAATAADQTILGKNLVVKNPTGAEIKRTVVVLGRETSTDIPALAGDPTAGGATIEMAANGTTSSSQSFTLPSNGWSVIGNGFRYIAPTGATDPVKKVILKRTPGGVALLRVLLKGNVGTQDLDIVPPNTGNDAVLSLQIAGGDRYCISFGGAAGSTEVKDDVKLWKVKNATSQPACPVSIACDCCGDLPKLLRVAIVGGGSSPGGVLPATCEGGSTCTTSCSEGQTCLGSLESNLLYVGGGDFPGSGLAHLYTRQLPVGTESYFKVQACSETAPLIGGASAVDLAEAGPFCAAADGTPSATARRCTTTGCRFGPPIDFTVYTGSEDPVCGINIVATYPSETVLGTISSCSTGAMDVSLPFNKDTYSGACPKCTGYTIGGCGSGTCDSGARADLGCTPESDSLTSHDCPPTAANLLSAGFGPFSAGGTTGSAALAAFMTDSNTNIFCGYCFDGTYFGAPCNANSDCDDLDVCTAQSNGAFGHTAAMSVSLTGSPAGSCLASGPGTVSLVSVGCVSNSSETAPVLALLGLPGPSASSMRATVEFVP